MTSNVQVIIRSAGERTEALCRSLILSQGILPDKVVTVRETPFSVAMLKSFEIGLQRGLPWTFCIDADVLLRPNSIKRMLEFAEQQPKEVCEIQGYVLCKFFGGPRPAGNHLYRTSMLERVIAKIPTEGVDIRPEFHTLEAMKAQGYPWLSVPYLVGLHDFEQYYRDIFRKCFVQAHKHNFLSDLFLDLWREGAAADQDYRVALAGFARGIEHLGPVHIDVRESVFGVEPSQLGVLEKSPISTDDWSLDRIEQVMQEWCEPSAYLAKFPDRLGLDVVEQVAWPQKLKQKYIDLGLLRSIVYFLGRLLAALGQCATKWSTKP